MKFKVFYSKGKEKIIKADSLEEAEEYCEQQLKTWTDIFYVDRTKAKISSEGY